MTYLLSTCRKPTAVLGSVHGNFDGTGEFHHLVLNCVNRLEVWEVDVKDLDGVGSLHEATNNNSSPLGTYYSGFASSNSGGGSNNDAPAIVAPLASMDAADVPLAPPNMRLVAELPMNATIKHLLAVPIPVARTSRHPRLCLFITTEKLDVCIIGLNRLNTNANTNNDLANGLASSSGSNSNASEWTIVPETLYSTNISSSLFHRHFGGQSLCVSSHPQSSFGTMSSSSCGAGGEGGGGSSAAASTAATSTPSSSATIFGEEDINPIVALSHIRSYIMLFDIAACIVEGAALACTKRHHPRNNNGNAASGSRKRGRNGQQQQEGEATTAPTANGAETTTAAAPSSHRTSGALSSNFGDADNDGDDDAAVDNVSQSTATTALTLPPTNSASTEGRRRTVATSAPATASASSAAIADVEGGGVSDEPTDAEVAQQLQSTRLFSMSYVSNSLLKKRSRLPFSYCPTMEPEPRSICLQRSCNGGYATKSLIVLHQDPLGRTHVRRYLIGEQALSNHQHGDGEGSSGSAAGARVGATVGHTMLLQRQIPMLAPIFDRSVLRLASKSTGLALTRGTTLQNDVETDAMLLHPLAKGVLIIGSVLATYVDIDGRSNYATQRHVSTAITPNPYARSEPVAVENISPISCIAGYVNGALIVFALDDGDRGDITCHTLAAETTPMTGLTTIGGGFFFASSAYHHSMFVHRQSGYCAPAIANTGPIVEMSVIDHTLSTNTNNSSAHQQLMASASAAGQQNLSKGGMAVVAATGVEHFTSLQVIRDAVQLSEEAAIEGLPGLLALHSVPAVEPMNSLNGNGDDGSGGGGGGGVGLLALSFANETRIMLFENTSALSLEEVDFECGEPTLCLGRVAPTAIVHATPSGASLLHLANAEVRPSGATVAFPRKAHVAIADPQCSTLLVACGNDVGIYELPSLQLLHTISFPYQVASMDMTAAYEVVVGLWDSNSVQMFTAEDLTPFTLVEGLPMLPKSLRLSSLVKSRFMADRSETLERAAMTERHLFIGFTDGSIGLLPVGGGRSSVGGSSAPLNASSAVGRLEHLALGSQPVDIIPILNSNRIHSGMLCTGDVPGALFSSPHAKGISSSAFGVRPIDSAAQLTATTFATYVAGEAKLIISSLDAKICHRVNAIATPIHKTVPKLKLIPRWNNLILAAQRESHQDTIVSYYVAGGVINKSTRVTAALTLLESERCEFIEFMELNGAPFYVAEGEVPQTDFSGVSSVNPFNQQQYRANNNASASTTPFLAKGQWDPAAPFAAALIGTNFAYPNDDIPRNGRIMLVGMERVNNKMSLVQLCERDIRGMVMCACMVPRTNNRILVGVTGCVHMYRWSANDKSFVFEISTSFGCAVTKLVPLSGSSLGALKARPQPPQIVAATPAVRVATRPGSQTSHRTLGGFSGITNSAASPTNTTDGGDGVADVETSSLVLCADMRNGLAVLALNPVELIRYEATERSQREVLDVVPAGNKAFIEKKTGLRVYDPHFITSDTDLNLFIVSALKEKKPATEGGSIYHLKGAVPQLSVCGQIHVGDRITVIQRGSLQAARKIKSSSIAYASSSLSSSATKALNKSLASLSVATVGAVDIASAAAAAAGNNLARISAAPQSVPLPPSFAEAMGCKKGEAPRGKHHSSILPDITERFANPTLPNNGAPPDTTIISRGVKDTTLPSFIYGTVHGAVGAITPLNPLAFNFLTILQRCIVKCIKPVGGLSYDNFKRVFNRETSPAITTNPHFAETADSSEVIAKRYSKLKSFNFVDGDALFQFLAPSAPSAASGFGMDDSAKAHAVHMTNKAIRAAAFSGELFKGTAVDAKLLGLGGSSPTAINNSALPPATAGNNGSAQQQGPLVVTPTALVVPSFGAAQTQAANSMPATPASLHPQTPTQQQQQALLTDANGVAYDQNGNKIATETTSPKRTTFTPSEMAHLNELLNIADLPEYPLTVESCERFLSDLQRFC